MKFAFEAVVKRVITDTITLNVEAKDELTALAKAEEVLRHFPEGHNVPGVDYCYIENRVNGDVEIISIEDQKDHGVA